jgi:hypothetical protein
MSDRQNEDPATGLRPTNSINDVGELKQFVVVHARAQNIPRSHYTQVLARIESDDGEGPGSWVGEWSSAARRFAADGRWLEACRDYNMARFPFVNGPGRAAALANCVEAFDRWRQGESAIGSLEADLPDGHLRCWAAGLSSAERKPLLLLMGGIVAVKEQWAPVLRQVRRLGMAGIVAELPGVGENTRRYESGSWRILSSLLDAVADRADVTRTCAVALSFSGHLALRCALNDSRIRTVITSGAPIRDFFLDQAWQRTVPRVTTDTLAHLADVSPADLWPTTRSWALSPADLAALDIPLHYMASKRDEVIPPGDIEHLRENVRRLRIVDYSDVHGAPGHVTESRLWTTRAILSAAGGHLPQRTVLTTMLAASRGRRVLAGSA